MPKFRITNRAANHRRKENGEWKSYRFNDEITLTEKAFQSGAYRHLGLQPVYGTQAAQGDADELESPAPDQTDDTTDETDTTDDDVSEEKVKELIEKAKDSKVEDGSFAKVRDEVVALDLFDNLPETKKGVIEALESLIEE